MVSKSPASTPKDHIMQTARFPQVVRTETQAANIAFSGARRRPALAMAGDTLVVCSSRTARKHGWTLVGRMFDRRANRTA